MDREVEQERLALFSLQRCLERERFGLRTKGTDWLAFAIEQLDLIPEAGYAIALKEVKRRLEELG